MMMWMLRRRKMMKLRRMILRRKTDPKTGKHTLREPAQSKFTETLHKRHFVREFSGKMPNANPGSSILCEPAQSKCTWAVTRGILRRHLQENAARVAHGHRFV